MQSTAQETGLTQQQLTNHLQYITGSKVASILNLPGAYKSKFQLFAEMKGLAEPANNESDIMLAGSCMELGMAEYCKRKWNWELAPGPEEGAFHPEYPFIYGLVDRLRKTDGVISHIVEFKNQDKFKEESWTDGVPEHFKSQVYLYMTIFGLPGLVVACFGGNKIEQFELPRNPMVEAFIIRKCHEFWQDLQHDRWPDPDDTSSCTEALKALYNAPTDEMEAGTQDLYEIAERYNIFSENEKMAKVNKDLAANELRARIGNKQGFIFGDGSKVTWKMTKPKTMKFNEEQFAREYPELYQRYLYKPEGYRRLHVGLKKGE